MITISSLSGICPKMSKNIHSKTTDDNQMVGITHMAIDKRQDRQQYLHMVDHNTKNEMNNFSP